MINPRSIALQVPGIDKKMGQRKTFADSDLLKINAMYCQKQNRPQHRPGFGPRPGSGGAGSSGNGRPNGVHPDYYNGHYPDYSSNYIDFGYAYPDYGNFNYGPPIRPGVFQPYPFKD